MNPSSIGIWSNIVFVLSSYTAIPLREITHSIPERIWQRLAHSHPHEPLRWADVQRLAAFQLATLPTRFCVLTRPHTQSEESRKTVYSVLRLSQKAIKQNGASIYIKHAFSTVLNCPVYSEIKVRSRLVFQKATTSFCRCFYWKPNYIFD